MISAISKTKLSRKQLDLLTCVGTWGYLTTREIALLVWPEITPKAAVKSAQLATLELKKEGLLLARELRICGVTKAYVLTRRGAQALNDELLQLAFTAGYSIEINRQVLRKPVVDLAHKWVAAKGLGAVGARGLARNVWELGVYKGLDGLLIDPDGLTPAFGILLVRYYDTATSDRIIKLVKRLPVPLLLAASEDRAKQLAALVKVRAKAAPAHEEHLLWNKPEGLLC
jgi:hypothetical protein